jgi:hypothetical protein
LCYGRYGPGEQHAGGHHRIPAGRQKMDVKDVAQARHVRDINFWDILPEAHKWIAHVNSLTGEIALPVIDSVLNDVNFTGIFCFGGVFSLLVFTFSTELFSVIYIYHLDIQAFYNDQK